MPSDSSYQEDPDHQPPQMPGDLDTAHTYIERLELKYRMVEQRLNEHLQRAQHLSDALAAERAARLAMQARVAELERQVQQLQGDQTVDQSTQEPSRDAT